MNLFSRSATAQVLGICLAAFACGESWGQTRVTEFVIAPGSTYTYTSAWLSYPECGEPGVPSFVCEFGVAGAFTVAEDLGAQTASITDANIELLGIDLPDPLGLQDEANVEQWLLDRTLAVEVDVDCVGPCQLYTDEGFEVFVSSVGFDGWENATLSGGFNLLPVDGPAIEFAVAAIVVPEPISLLLAAPLLVTPRRKPRRNPAPSGR